MTVGEREVALLPAPAADLLRQATKLDPAGYEVATEDARAFVEALIEAGLEPLAMPMGEAVVRFSLEHPDHPGNSLVVFFGPGPASRRGGLPWARVSASHERLPSVRPDARAALPHE